MKLCVRHDHPSLPGHFPTQPIVPGVVILDHVQRAIEAQAGVAKQLRISQVKFLQPLLPDEMAELAFEPKGDGYAFRVTRDAVLLVNGEMVLG